MFMLSGFINLTIVPIKINVSISLVSLSIGYCIHSLLKNIGNVSLAGVNLVSTN